MKKARKQFFFEKKNQKTFPRAARCVAAEAPAAQRIQKFFVAFFQNRTAFSAS
jgi:hypothetical protein